MNHYLYSLLALDIARQRSREAEQHWLESALIGTAPSRASRLRRVAAQLLASVSRGSASIVRRLDSCVADDLGRALAPAE
ncbi:MAG: hypothetical protein Q7S35_08785 [Candidatus Limnocylindrales bacterium]|nr:hypothetical protein [Candidatus Limnocylindrales bacterium]